AAHFAEAACKRGERVLYFCFEESPNQLMRNMLSIGIKLEPWVRKGLLRFQASRPTLYGLEMHLAVTHKFVNEFNPSIVILDPINTFVIGDKEFEVKTLLMRIVDFLKVNQITALFTSLTSADCRAESSDVGISSLIDTWLLLRDIELNGERNRGMYVLKSRGIANSNQIREFVLTNQGVELRDVYIGANGVLTGSARIAQEAIEISEVLMRKHDIEFKKREIERKRRALELRIATLHADFDAQESEAIKIIEAELALVKRLEQDKIDMAENRNADIKRFTNDKLKENK
ncbi:MAG: ATPase domain-containing protein, partial [Bacteroidales bacterium]|nr:ATPase domain-containing protein [Bacteroidales bacterium]